jgi:hypothetical protein
MNVKTTCLLVYKILLVVSGKSKPRCEDERIRRQPRPVKKMCHELNFILLL